MRHFCSASWKRSGVVKLVPFSGKEPTLSLCYKTMSLQIGLIGRDCFLIPLKTDAGHVRNVKQSVTNIIRFLQDRIGPVLPFQPMRGLGDAHHVRGHLGVKVSGHRYAGRKPFAPAQLLTAVSNLLNSGTPTT
jgi:hypothetical protein